MTFIEPASRVGIARTGTDVATVAQQYRAIAEDARDNLAHAKRMRPAAPRNVAHWQEIADRADSLYAGALALSRAHIDLEVVAVTGSLVEVATKTPDTSAGRTAADALAADESEYALLLAHTEKMRHPDAEPEPDDKPEPLTFDAPVFDVVESPTPHDDDHGYAATAAKKRRWGRSW